MTNHSKEECESKINVERAITGENICYSFIPKDSLVYSLVDISSSFSHHFDVYSLILNNSFYTKAKQIIIITHFPSKFRIPLNSRRFGQKVARIGKDDNIIRVSFWKVVYQLLPPPADTHCIYDFDQDWCFNICINAALEKVNRYPWSVFIEESSQKNMRIISALDLKQKSMQYAFANAQEQCNYCRNNRGCTTEFTHTYLVVSSEPKTVIELSAMTPTDLEITIETVQIMKLVEFFGHIAGSFGIWLGISISTVNPTKWILFWRGKRNVQQTLRGRQSMTPHGAFVKTSTITSRLNLR
jgi:hypothetical protein